MKVSTNGLGFAVGYDPAATVTAMRDAIVDAEATGFDMGFFSETINTNRDSVSAVSAFASATETIALGTTQVLRLRSPLVMAQTAATLDELSGGRLVLVVGACTDQHARRNGLPPLAPPQVLREYLTCIRELLSGDPVTFHGETMTLDRVGLNWTPIRADLPLWVAGASRTGLRIAGELGDGILLDAATSPEYTASALAIVRRAREKVGRTMDDFTVAQLINTSIAETRADALAAVRWEVASKFREPATMRAKIAVGETNIDPEAPDRLSKVFHERGLEALIAEMPDQYVAALTASGTLPDVADRVARYRAAGVDLPLLRAASTTQMPGLLAAAGQLRARATS